MAKSKVIDFGSITILKNQTLAKVIKSIKDIGIDIDIFKYIKVNSAEIIECSELCVLSSSKYDSQNRNLEFIITVEKKEEKRTITGTIEIEYEEDSFYKITCPDYEHIFDTITKKSKNASLYAIEDMFINILDENYVGVFGDIDRTNMLDTSWKYTADFTTEQANNYLYKYFYGLTEAEYQECCATVYSNSGIRQKNEGQESYRDILLVKGTTPRQMEITGGASNEITVNEKTKSYFYYVRSDDCVNVVITRGIGKDTNNNDISGFFVKKYNKDNNVSERIAYTANQVSSIVFEKEAYSNISTVFSNLGYVPYCLGCCIWGGGGGGACLGTGGGGGSIGVLTLNFTTQKSFTVDLGSGGVGGKETAEPIYIGSAGGMTKIVANDKDICSANGGNGGTIIDKRTKRTTGGKNSWSAQKEFDAAKKVYATIWLNTEEKGGQGGYGGIFRPDEIPSPESDATKFLIDNNIVENYINFYSLLSNESTNIGASCKIYVGEPGQRDTKESGGPGGGSLGNGGKPGERVVSKRDGANGYLGGGGGGTIYTDSTGITKSVGGDGGPGGVFFWY